MLLRLERGMRDIYKRDQYHRDGNFPMVLVSLGVGWRELN